jgi:hypothetical protein
VSESDTTKRETASPKFVGNSFLGQLACCAVLDGGGALKSFSAQVGVHEATGLLFLS